jgi:hypothetical protein
MNDEDFKAAFRNLDKVEPSAEFLRRVRSIPHAFPRESTFVASLWSLLGAPSRLVALGISASCGLFVGYMTLEEEPPDDELTAFMDLGADDTSLTGVNDLDGNSP